MTTWHRRGCNGTTPRCRSRNIAKNTFAEGWLQKSYKFAGLRTAQATHRAKNTANSAFSCGMLQNAGFGTIPWGGGRRAQGRSHIYIYVIYSPESHFLTVAQRYLQCFVHLLYFLPKSHADSGRWILICDLFNKIMHCLNTLWICRLHSELVVQGGFKKSCCSIFKPTDVLCWLSFHDVGRSTSTERAFAVWRLLAGMPVCRSPDCRKRWSKIWCNHSDRWWKLLVSCSCTRWSASSLHGFSTPPESGRGLPWQCTSWPKIVKNWHGPLKQLKAPSTTICFACLNLVSGAARQSLSCYPRPFNDQLKYTCWLLIWRRPRLVAKNAATGRRFVCCSTTMATIPWWWRLRMRS